MTTWRKIAALFLTAFIVLAPAFAEARAGGSYGGSGSSRGGSFSSQGSMGSRTYSPNGAAPVQRSVTPQPSPSYARPGYTPSYGASHPFLSGLAGGLFGSWIGSMLFPHWGGGMGYAGGGGMGMIGSLFTWLIIIGLIWFAFRWFRGSFRTAQGPGLGAVGYGGSGMGGYGGGYNTVTAPPPQGAPLAIAGGDYQVFEDTLKHVQAAWSRGDINELRKYVTPEMLSYFSEELAGNQSRGVVNHVDQVELLRGDLREAWDEGTMQYASTNLRWRARDYTTRVDGRPGEPELIVDGDPQTPVEASEVWTFARAPGGRWLLSAIQQV